MGGRWRVMRFKNRFLLLRIRGADSPPPSHELLRWIRSSVSELHGDYGYGCIQNSLNVRQCVESPLLFVLRIDRERSEMLRSAISMIASLDGGKSAVSVDTLALCSSQSKCEEAAKQWIERQQQLLGAPRCTPAPAEDGQVTSRKQDFGDD